MLNFKLAYRALVPDEMVHFAVGNEIFVRRVLREVRKLQAMEISRIGISRVLLIPEVLEDKGFCSRQSRPGEPNKQ
jgi:hypothetical protein